MRYFVGILVVPCQNRPSSTQITGRTAKELTATATENTSRSVLVVVTTAALLVLSACSQKTQESAAGNSASTGELVAENSASKLSVNRGSRIEYSNEILLIHKQTLDSGALFCGWIPAGCPVCNQEAVAPVYLWHTPVAVPPKVMVVCSKCGKHVDDWSAPFALLAQPAPVPSNISVPESLPAWIGKGSRNRDEAIRRYLQERTLLYQKTQEPNTSTNSSEQLKEALRNWAACNSGILVDDNSEESKRRYERACKTIKTSLPEEAGIRLVMDAINEAHSIIPSDAQLVRSRKVQLNQMRRILGMHNEASEAKRD